MVEGVVAFQGNLIAVESELEGLGHVCTDNNSVKARIEGLKHQLENLGGKGEGATSISDQASDSIYPPIRGLPLLGVIYTDLQRGTKIQETVLETFTKEYDLVKVQEAKEIPTVKTLDTANIPDKKSFSPRLLFTIGDTLFALGLTVSWIFLQKRWGEIDLNDPGRLLVEEMAATFRSGARRLLPATAGLREPVVPKKAPLPRRLPKSPLNRRTNLVGGSRLRRCMIAKSLNACGLQV